MAFKHVTSRFYLHLPPTCISDPGPAIAKQLGELVLSYHQTLGGVVLSITNMRTGSSAKRVMFDSPFLHIHVTADVLLFAPRTGLKLEGKVNFLGPTHIGLLVEGAVNVSIMAEKIPENWAFDEDDEGEPVWYEEGKESEPTVLNANLEFYVTQVNVKHGDISLQGSLLDQDASDDHEDKEHERNGQTPVKKNKKEKKSKKDKKSARKHSNSKKRSVQDEGTPDKPKKKLKSR
eukprot:TRINITY_DN22727_c0_g1_i2.p1 TRINITY_DN22727_c0_g1~~TRINITY_DN22727_c0_g1_i2.p1  ORF type:complete len:233 (-),score=33.07 TRINITY_DN22727_c0_g1_i2:14-712(-)